MRLCHPLYFQIFADHFWLLSFVDYSHHLSTNYVRYRFLRFQLLNLLHFLLCLLVYVDSLDIAPFPLRSIDAFGMESDDSIGIAEYVGHWRYLIV